MAANLEWLVRERTSAAELVGPGGGSVQWVSFQRMASSRSRRVRGRWTSRSASQPQAFATRRWQRVSSALPAAIVKKWMRSLPCLRLPPPRLAATDEAASSICFASCVALPHSLDNGAQALDQDQGELQRDKGLGAGSFRVGRHAHPSAQAP